ncbi:AEC family transporter [Mangrovicoccus sp. HB161399]|uniref:AEC family transporter n=1 Tax=Mangrovicoccus sp. HB161399 TaxID=2720392 RepID=UPI001555BF0F|nr:AEC family transporter [Mangrovicoccus sp. HB161399]
MSATFSIVLPIFALIFAGWAARRGGALGPGATRELNRLVVYLALPALLFRIMAEADPAEIWHPGFIAAFTGGCAAVFAAAVGMRMRQGRPLADAALDGLNASYANTGFLGFPLILAVAGEAALGLTLVATLVTVAVLFAVAILLVEFGLQQDGRAREIVLRTLAGLARNPLILSPLAGAAFLATGLDFPAPMDRFLGLLGSAAAPCALVTLGCFLAETPRPAESGRDRTAFAALVSMKLAVQPLATWVLAVPLLQLPGPVAQTAVLLAALPTGTGPFMLAEFYGREALMTGRVILATTVLSVATLSAYLAVAL